MKEWERDLDMQIPINDWLQNFKNVYRVTNHNKIRSFQYCLLHHAIITNETLKNWQNWMMRVATYVVKCQRQ